MHFWLVQTGEELPIDGPGTRLLRTAILAEELSARGHEVTYVNAAFNHQRKLMRCEQSKIIRRGDDPSLAYDCVLLAGRAYSANVSIGRFIHHREVASAFAEMAPTMKQPDAILCGLPTIELARAVADYAQRRGIPCAMDCRDMWPEVIEERVPGPIRPLARLALSGMTRQKREALSAATAITGITDHFVDWGLSAAGRDRGPRDRAFHLAVSPSPVDPEALHQANEEWTAQLDHADREHRPPVIGCFVGTYASRTDLLSIVDGANLLDEAQRQALRIVICGKGDLEAELVSRSAGNPAIILAGWQSAPRIAALMARSSFGILPYPNTPDFLASFPNKVGEYLMAGLPIMTGLAGATGDLLNRHKLALPYQVGDARSVAERLSAIINAPVDANVHQQAADLGAEHFNPARIYPAFADWLEQLAKPNTVQSMEALTA